MKSIILCGVAVMALSACAVPPSPDADERQAQATRTALNAADREIGMPRIANFSQRKLLKNAYEDMDQTTLTYVYTQSAVDGLYVCLGQAVGYGVSMGTQFTAPHTPDYLGQGGVYEKPQAEPNGLFMPESGAATIVNLIDPTTGKSRTTLMEPDVITTPNRLHAGAVKVACPADVDPANVKDAAETSVVQQR